jgi:hypothetical protein
MTQTVFPVIYRDSSNWKTYGTLVADGAITDAELETLRTSLRRGEQYLPHNWAWTTTAPTGPGTTPRTMTIPGTRCSSTRSRSRLTVMTCGTTPLTSNTSAR